MPVEHSTGPAWPLVPSQSMSGGQAIARLSPPPGLCAGETNLERSWISRPWLCVEREASPTLPPVFCGFVFPGPRGGDAFEDTEEGAGRPFLSPGIWETEARTETAGLPGCQGSLLAVVATHVL